MQLNLADYELSVSEFVALVNQTFEHTIPSVVITGELANFRVSKNRWVYFDLKDDEASVKFFGTVYNLPGPLEEGMLLRVHGRPQLHTQYGFSVTIHAIQPAGEGSIKRAAELLQAKLEKEGLFAEDRKRSLPFPPKKIGLITSQQSAAYADFIKIINARWKGLAIELIDVQVQGEVAPAQIVAALEQYNAESLPPDVLVLIRGGGSPEDLAAYSTEQVARAVAASRVPTLVAIGHETDISLAELAGDLRASTPSNAAELLVPDKRHVLNQLQQATKEINVAVRRKVALEQQAVSDNLLSVNSLISQLLQSKHAQLDAQLQLLSALSPQAILRRGYGIVRANGQEVRHIDRLKTGDTLTTELASGTIDSTITKVKQKGTQNVSEKN